TGAVGLPGEEVGIGRGDEPAGPARFIFRRREARRLLVERGACSARPARARRLGGHLELHRNALVRAGAGERTVAGALLGRLAQVAEAAVDPPSLGLG